jgi:hypothetical protein
VGIGATLAQTSTFFLAGAVLIMFVADTSRNNPLRAGRVLSS